MAKKSEFTSLDLISAYTEKKADPTAIDLDKISVNPNQPRIIGRNQVEDLIQSMDRLGLIEPILVRRDRQGYVVVAGERRYHAAKALGWKSIQAVVTDASEDICYEMALAENEKRKNLNPWEVGKAIAYLRKEKKKTAEEVARLLGYTERYVKQLSSIARLDERTVLEMVRTNQPLTVKSLEKVLKKKEGRDEIISPSGSRKTEKIVLEISHLPSRVRESFMRDLKNLKKKYGLE